jgi:hypothetical protein
MGIQWKRFYQTFKAKFGWVISIVGFAKWIADWWGRGEIAREWMQHLPHSLQFLNEKWVVPLAIIVGLGMVVWAALDRGGSVGFDNVRWLPEVYRHKRVPHEYIVGSAVISAVVLTGLWLHGRTVKKEVVIAPSEQHATLDALSAAPVVTVKRQHIPVKSENMIPQEILDQLNSPRQWRKNPLGQSVIGLQQTFEAGICDQGVPDLTKEIPGPWQNWGLQGARFGCPSNQFATQGTIDFDPKGFSYANTRTMIPSNFSSQTMDVSIAWYSERTDGYVKWVVDRACVHRDEILRNAELIDAANILARPDPNHSLNVSSAKVSLGGCKPKDTLVLRLARNGEDNDDTLSATVHVEKMSLDMR